jgi:hypothetical protein
VKRPIWKFNALKHPCGWPAARPDPNRIRQTFAWEVVTLVIFIGGTIALVLR